MLGWAIKYQALTALLGQEAYVFDISVSRDSGLVDISGRLGKLMESYDVESKRIKAELLKAQKENCFDRCREVLNQEQTE